jgi:hypothetical protein
MMPIVIELLQSNAVKQMIDRDEDDNILQRIQALPPGFSGMFKECTVSELFGIINLLAHPRFNAFLSQLPPATDFSQLALWLRSDVDALPVDIQPPMRELWDYQDNHERIEQASQQAYRNIKQKFSLRVEDLHAFAAHAQPKSDIEVPHALPQSLWMVLFNLQLTHLILAYAVLLVANFAWFGLPILWVTGGFFLVFVAPLVYKTYAEAMQHTSEDKFPSDVIPPLAWSTPLGFEEAALREPETQPSVVELEPQSPILQASGLSVNRGWSFFEAVSEKVLPKSSVLFSL